jgi:hypothetical protein
LRVSPNDGPSGRLRPGDRGRAPPARRSGRRDRPRRRQGRARRFAGVNELLADLDALVDTGLLDEIRGLTGTRFALRDEHEDD